MHFCICNVLISTTCGVLAKTQVHSSFLEAKKENKTTLSSDVIQQQHGHDYSFARHPSFYNNTIIETRKERGSPAFYLCFNKVVEAVLIWKTCLVFVCSWLGLSKSPLINLFCAEVPYCGDALEYWRYLCLLTSFSVPTTTTKTAPSPAA